MVVVAAFSSFLVLTLLLLGVALLWLRNALRLTDKPGQLRTRRALAVAAGCALVLAAAGAIVASLLVAAIPVKLVAGLLCWFVIVWYRQGELNSFYWSLGMAMRHNASLAEEARHISLEREDAIGRLAGRLADRLENGEPVRKVLPALVPRADLDRRLLLQIGAEYQLLDHVLLERDSASEEITQTLTKVFESTLYLLLAFVVGGALITFYFVSVLPVMFEMFEEFEIAPSPVAELMVLLAYNVHRWGFLAILVMAVLWLLVGTMALAAAQQMQLLFIDLPIVSRWGRSLDRARFLEALSLAAMRQRSMAEACALMSEAYPKRFMRRKMDRALERMNNGQEWSDSLRATGLITVAQQGVLRSAERVGNLAWALRELASLTRRRYAGRARLLLDLATSLVVFVLGLGVFGIAVGLFDILTRLIHGLA